MPAWVQDEGKWEAAKLVAEDDLLLFPMHDSYWPVVTGIYKKMGGRIRKSRKRKRNPDVDKITDRAIEILKPIIRKSTTKALEKQPDLAPMVDKIVDMVADLLRPDMRGIIAKSLGESEGPDVPPTDAEIKKAESVVESEQKQPTASPKTTPVEPEQDAPSLDTLEDGFDYMRS